MPGVPQMPLSGTQGAGSRAGDKEILPGAWEGVGRAQGPGWLLLASWGCRLGWQPQLDRQEQVRAEGHG